MACFYCGSDKGLERNGNCPRCNRDERREKTAYNKEKLKREAALKKQKEKKKLSPIAKVSDKMAKLLSVYTAKKKAWIKGKRCAVEPSREAVDVHHIKGRIGYVDQWARDNDIPLLIDERFWLPVSRMAHIEITANPEWAVKEGYSMSRHEKLTEIEKSDYEQNTLT